MKIKPIYIAVFFIILLFTVFFFLLKKSPHPENTSGVPQQPIHWHPKLKIIIKDEEQFIPQGIGISVGNNNKDDIIIEYK